jgi:hypothetical protein
MTAPSPGVRALGLLLTLGCLLTMACSLAPSGGQAASPADVPRAVLPRHYSHIRIAMLAYHAKPLSPFEQDLLKSSVDLVVPDERQFKPMSDLAPKTPLLAYTNTSTLYLDVLTDWLAFADRKGVSREVAFYHAAIARPFKGNSPSSQPVTWFWRVSRGGGRSFTNLTTAARGPAGNVQFGGPGDSLYLGYPDRFGEINVALAAAGENCSIVSEYCANVDGTGRPTSWQALPLTGDGTAGLTQSGRFTFDPPVAWKPAVIDGPARLYYVRLRTVKAGQVPIAASVLGRDYVNARGTTSGVIPVFDARADLDGDGYLNDAEYARRAPGKDARFLYESRTLTGWYGQMRFVTRPTHPAFQEWAADFQKRLLARLPLAAGLFMDNSGGKLYHTAADVLEPVDNFAHDYGALMAAIARSIGPRWILLNTEGGGINADPVIKHNPAYLEEFGLKPLDQDWQAFEKLLNRIERRAKLSDPPPLAVIDSHPTGGAVDDPRTQLATLAAYYLMADPDSTALMFFGGYEPGTSWQRHWVPAAAFDIGRPKAKWTRFATGADPGGTGLTYCIYARSYDKALVLYRPLSLAQAKGARGNLRNDTATRHELGATYRPLQADGSLAAPVSSISLRNGEGAVLVRSDP